MMPNPNPTPDATLLAHFQAGDQEAIAALLARYHGLVRAACTRQAAPGEVDDCIQAVFLVLSRRPQSAVRAGNLPGWLLTTAWYVCRRTHRARARRQRAERVVAQQAGAGEIPSEPEALAHLDDCLRRLPESQRTVITLHDLVGQSFDEIAERLGLTRDHVYQLRHRGLGTIRQLLARRGFAVGAVAVASLFASQAQAASTSSPLLVATLCANPTPAATTLATGAMTAMTVATATPFAVAASLIFATGIGTSVLTAEKPPAPILPVTVSTPVPQPTTIDFLDQELSLDFNDHDFRNALAEVGRKAGFTPIVASDLITAPITLRAEKMKVRYILQFMCRLTDTDYIRSENSIRIIPAIPAPPVAATPPKPIGIFLNPMPAEQRAQLQKKIQFDLEDAPLADYWTLLRSNAKLDVILSPELLMNDTDRLTLKVKEMRVEDTLSWVAQLNALRIEWRDAVLFVSRGVSAPVQGPFSDPLDPNHPPTALQGSLEQRVTIEIAAQPLSEVLMFVRKLSNTNLVLDPALSATPDERPVTLTLKDKPLRDVLQQIASQARVRMTYLNQTLLVFDPKLARNSPMAAPLNSSAKPAPEAEQINF
jgi:RNA polymerase sigma factor (sigma-70 family)